MAAVAAMTFITMVLDGQAAQSAGAARATDLPWNAADDRYRVGFTASGGAIASEPWGAMKVLPDTAQPLGDVGMAPRFQPVQAEVCTPRINAQPAAGAMIDVSVSAPCHAGKRVTLHHYGLSVTERMGPDGRLFVRLPALVETAIVIADFGDGSGGSAVTTVTELPLYDRVVLQWRAGAGLELHAREFGADYFADGHVWAKAAGDLDAAVQGSGGFLVSLGVKDEPDARLAEVYSFPTGDARRAGAVLLTVEAEVTAGNCGRAIEGQTIQHRAGRPLRARELEVLMPPCEGIGDYLVLKNLLDDLTIAMR
jgi:hypothetical protein